MAQEEQSSDLGSLDVQIEKIDESIEIFKSRIVKSKKMIKLCNNAEFKELILEGLLGQEMVDAATGLVTDSGHTAESEQRTLEELRSLRKLKHYIDRMAQSLGGYEEMLKMEEDYKIELMNLVENQEEM